MGKEVLVRVVTAADGGATPHDGRYVVAWNPHTAAGDLSLTSTADPAKARRFSMEDAFSEWRRTSKFEPRRPWDGRPNRPLTGVTIELVEIP